MLKNWRTFVVIGIAVVLFLTPLLSWGSLYIVGGDDARLYYLYPLEYLKNFSFNVLSGNTLGGNLGYVPVSYSAPIIVFLLVLKNLLPHANTQLTSYGIILSLGFLFFYCFLQELYGKKSTFYFVSSVIASLSYILSLYISKTFFQSQFISVFLVMVVPGSLYLFLSGLNRKSTVRVISSALLYSLFGSSVLGFPWLLPVLLTLIPFFVYLAIRYGRYFWKMTFLFVGVFIFCNVFWIIHYVLPVVYKTNEANYISSLLAKSFVLQNNNIVTSLVYLNSPIHQIIQYLRTSWQDRQGATLLQSAGAIFLFIILAAGVMLRKVKKQLGAVYLTATGCLLTSMMFATPNLGLWNLKLFQFLVTHVPFFVIFRNMYDKFALAMAFNYAFALWISLIVLHEARIRKIYLYILILIVLFVTVMRSVPYMHPDYKETAYSTRISSLNTDYMDLARYIRNMNTSSRFVWYLMTFGDYVYISDQTLPGHYYIGVSPLQIFARASDLAGFYGLQTPGDPELHWRVLSLLQQKKYAEVGTIFKRQNVGYVIVNNEPFPRGVSFILEQFDFVKSQNEQYKQTILGEKIRDFGARYSLYSINPEFRSPTVFLDDKEVSFHRTADGSYDIGPLNTSQKTLVLMEPYSRLWKLTPPQGANTLAYGYGNSWLLDPKKLGPSEPTVHAEFWPNKLIVPSLVFSIISGILAGVYCVVTWLKKRI